MEFCDIALDGALAERLIHQLESVSPISFAAPITAAGEAGVGRVFQFFESRKPHWACSLYFAHYLLATGRADASAPLARARARFEALGERIVGDPPPWRAAMKLRLDALAGRLNAPDGRDLYRADSERQAEDLGLPRIVWA